MQTNSEIMFLCEFMNLISNFIRKDSTPIQLCKTFLHVQHDREHVFDNILMRMEELYDYMNTVDKTKARLVEKGQNFKCLASWFKKLAKPVF